MAPEIIVAATTSVSAHKHVRYGDLLTGLRTRNNKSNRNFFDLLRCHPAIRQQHRSEAGAQRTCPVPFASTRLSMYETKSGPACSDPVRRFASTFAPTSSTVTPHHIMTADKPAVTILARSQGSRKTSFKNVNCLMEAKSVCNRGRSAPASSLPKSSLNARSLIRSIVRQLVHVVMSTMPP
jgi:hypothetical protein